MVVAYRFAPKETVLNFSGRQLDDAVYPILLKGLNYAVAVTVLPRDDILTGVEKAKSLSVTWLKKPGRKQGS
jgi:hypothetical protein